MRDNQQRMTFKAIKNCQKERFAVTGAKNLYICKRESALPQKEGQAPFQTIQLIVNNIPKQPITNIY